MFDFNFNHNFRDRVKNESLKDYFIFFKGKSSDQIERILSSIKKVSENLNHPPKKLILGT
jgi:hypothetical protein